MLRYETLKSKYCAIILAVRQAIRPGALCHDVAYAFNTTLEKNGYRKESRCGSNINQGLTTGIGVVAAVLIRGDAAGWYTVVGLTLVLIGVVLSTRQV